MDDDAETREGGDDGFERLAVGALLNGARQLREGVALDESGFFQVAALAHKNARDHWIWLIADELTRSALTITRHLDTAQPEDDNVEDELHARRGLLVNLDEELALRQRILTEALAKSICFGQTNEHSYYGHYFLVEELTGLGYRQRDLEEFFAHRSQNLDIWMDRVRRQLVEAEQSLDLDVCWYLSDRKPIEERQRLPLASFRDVLKRAIEQADDHEKVILGLSYRFYSAQSEAVHFNLEPQNADMDRLRRRLTAIGLAGIALLKRAARLAALDLRGSPERLAAAVERSEAAERILAETAARAGKGDFVLVHGGYLGEVVTTKSSRYGYDAYEVRFLADRPLPEIEADWFPARQVRHLLSPTGIQQRAGDLLAEHGVQTAEHLPIDVIRKSVVAAWREGVVPGSPGWRRRFEAQE